MENKTSVEPKSTQSVFSKPFTVENTEVLRENLKKSYNNEFRYLENISLNKNMKFEVPNELLVNKIIQQVEYLFSDANISKDKFLLKHIRRNKEGYVSLKLISSLRKVKALSKDWRTVAYSLKQSYKLAMNAEMTKIKRVDPLPLPEDMDPSRTVLVFNYPSAGLTFENLKKRMNMLGTVVSAVNMKSKADVTDANVKKTFIMYEKIASFPFAIVKFEKPDESINAVLHTSHPTSVWKIVQLIEDENEAFKTSMYSPTGERKWNITNERFSAKFEERKACIQSADVPKGGIKPSSACFSAYKVNRMGSGKWAQKNSRTDKDVPPTSKEPFVIILRQPKGPDSTQGFHRRLSEIASASISGSCSVV